MISKNPSLMPLVKTFNLLAACLLVTAITSCKKDKVNKAPLADAGPTQTIQLRADSATLTGSGSDEDGTIVTYLWTKVSGPNVPTIHTPGSATTKVTALIAGTYLFQLKVIDNAGATGQDTVSVNVLPAQAVTITLQPGLNDGQDALVLTKDGDNSTLNVNFGQHAELNYSKWTYSGQGFGEGPMRSYIKFTGLSVIPTNAEIMSAKLSLYGVATSAFTPQGNSHYPGSPFGSNPDNAASVKRVTTNWDESTITWSNKPGTSDVSQAAIAGTTSQWNFHATDVDVTEMVRTMISTNSNYGFCLALQDETIRKNVLFSSSEATDASRRPKLVVTYR